MSVGFNGTMLAVFTVLAPAGALSFALLATLACGWHVSSHVTFGQNEVARLEPALVIPLLVTWAGFISASTHLGMPSNALFVVDGIGRSPLSNEVAATVGFLLFSGIYWLYSFRPTPSARISTAFLVPAFIFAVAMVVLSAVAYRIETIPSWDSWHPCANLILSAILGATVLSLSVIDVLFDKGLHRLRMGLLLLGLLALVLATVVAWA